MSTAVDPLLRRLGAQIAQERQAAGLTQTALADELGIDTRSLQRIESGHAAPSIARLVELAEVLGVSAGRFLDAASQDGTRMPKKAAEQLSTDRSLYRAWTRVPEERRTLAIKILRVLATDE